MPELDALIDILVVVCAAEIAAEVAERIRLPAVVGEIAAGVLVGPSVLGLVETSDVLRVLAELGVILLLLDVGLEMDLGELRTVGRSALAVAVVGVVVPFAGGLGAGTMFGWDGTETLFVAAALTATSVGISARVFGDLRALGTPEARTVLGAAVADDVIGLVILTVVVRIAETGGVSASDIGIVVVSALGFLVIALTVGIRLIPPLFDHLTTRSRSAGTLVAAAFVFALAVAELASLAKLAPIVGAFVAGLALAPSRAAERVRRELAPVGHLLVPIFFLQIGIEADIALFADAEVLGVAAVLCVIGVAGKLASGIVASSRSGDRLLIGIGMIPRGEVGLIFAAIGLRQGVFGEEVYASLLLVVLVTTLLTPPVLRLRVARHRDAALPPPSSEQPDGGWFTVHDGVIELTARPGAHRAAAAALEAANRADALELGETAAEWLGTLGHEPLPFGAEARPELWTLIGERGVRSWRALYGTGALRAVIPELDAAIGARDRQFTVDPWASLRFARTSALRDQGSAVRDDPVLLAALVLDLCDGDRDRAVGLAIAIGERIGQQEVGSRASTLVRAERVLHEHADHPDALSAGATQTLAAFLGSTTVVEDLVRLGRADDSLDRVERDRVEAIGQAVGDITRRHEGVGGLIADRRRQALEITEDEDVATVLEHAPDAWLMEFAPIDLARLATSIASASPHGDDVTVHVHELVAGAGAEVTVVAADRIGLLARTARGLADSGLDIGTAVIASWPDGRAASTFVVRGFYRPDPHRIATAIRAAMSSPVSSAPMDDVTMTFPAGGSPWHTTCRVAAPDRFGLLAGLAGAFAASGITVHSARVATRQRTAINVFELARPDGSRLGGADHERVLQAVRSGVRLDVRRRWSPWRRSHAGHG